MMKIYQDKARIRKMRVFCTLLLVLFVSSCGRNEKYPSGKDTIESFGNGCFQIGRTAGSPYHLYDHKNHKMLIRKIQDYKKVGNKIFMLGNKYYKTPRYTILFLDEEKAVQYNDLKEIPKEYLSTFKGLKEVDY